MYISLWGVLPVLRANIVDFGGFDSSIALVLRGELLMSMGNFPESLTRAMLVGVMLVRGLGYIYIYMYVLNVSLSIYR